MFANIKISSNKIAKRGSFFRALWWLGLANLAVLISIGLITGGVGLHFAPLILLLGGLSPFILLYLSRWMAKRTYAMEIISDRETDTNLKELYQLVDTLRQKANIEKMPEVAIYDSEEVNAFATGYNRNNSLIAFSHGLLNQMSADEIAAVAAHEIAHVANGDMIILSLVQAVVNTITLIITVPLWLLHVIGIFSDGASYLACLIIWVVRVIIAAVLMFLGIMVVNFFSRKREFAADKLAAELLSKQYMINALKRLQAANDEIDDDKAHARLSAMKISGRLGFLGEAFSSHPSLELRIEALNMASVVDGGAYLIDTASEPTSVSDTTTSKVSTEQMVTAKKLEMVASNYPQILIQSLAILIVAEGQINDEITEFASTIVEHDEFIGDKAPCLVELAQQIEHFVELRANSSTIFKLKISPAINALANLTSDEQERFEIILNGIQEFAAKGSATDEIITMMSKKIH